ncbi:MAG: hemolysin family protein [Candidatus Hydrogenedentes bacterium]|nr:hemolysin family protein [Candidatus Hydrogenedentota bacterium]
MTVLIFSVAIAMAVSAMCSLLEAVLLSLTPSQIADVGRTAPATAKVWQDHKTHIQRPIAVILIVNTLSHTVGATVAGAQFESLFGREWIVAFSLLFSFLILQFTEILPKTLGVRYNRDLAFYVGVPLLWAVRIMRPVVTLVHWLNKPFEGRAKASDPKGTLDELSALASMARVSNLIGAHEERIITRATAMSDTPVSEIMIPHDQITFVSTSQSLTEAILTAHFDPHTRFPICEGGDHNKVLGYINFKELIYRARTNPSDPSLRGIIRPVHFTSSETTAADLLRTFVEEHVHMAVVRGEENVCLGLVTMEDLVEELVGELEDEFDRLPRMCHALTGGTWMVGGGFPADRLSEQLGVELSDPKGSTSAWLIARMGGVPKANDVYREAGLEFLIRRTRRGKVFEVAVSAPRPVGEYAPIIRKDA